MYVYDVYLDRASAVGLAKNCDSGHLFVGGGALSQQLSENSLHFDKWCFIGVNAIS